jgi:hypothetical protein
VKRDDLRKLIHQAVPSHIDQTLANWGAWCRQAPGRGCGACFSAEGRYRRRGDDTDSVIADVPVDEHDAARVESIMRHLPDKDRGLLIGHYAYRMPWQPLCRVLVLRINREGFDNRLRRAAHMAWNRYELVRDR